MSENKNTHIAQQVRTSFSSMVQEVRIIGTPGNWQYWGGLLLLGSALAFLIPALIVFPSNSTSKIHDYFRHVGVTTAWFGGAIIIVWLLEFMFDRSPAGSP